MHFVRLTPGAKNKVQFLFSFFYTCRFNFSFIQADTSKAAEATRNKFDEKSYNYVVYLDVQLSLAIHYLHLIN
jgi:hypothetical protein